MHRLKSLHRIDVGAAGDAGAVGCAYAAILLEQAGQKTALEAKVLDLETQVNGIPVLQAQVGANQNQAQALQAKLSGIGDVNEYKNLTPL